MKTIIVTGGAGFIGSALIRHIIKNTAYRVINIDKLTYASNSNSLYKKKWGYRYKLEKFDICNSKQIRKLLNRYQPIIIFHLAAESHVDNSIDRPSDFIKTNILGTFSLLEETRRYHSSLNNKKKKEFRFLHISTDEVYGDLKKTQSAFTEESRYMPSSPYSASKASSDHLVRSWFRTYNLPIIITNCSNNYGPYQNQEKLIPKIILSAINKKTIPIYGNGKQIRDWLYVDDHVKALMLVALKGKVGETYNIGGNSEKENIYIAKYICNEISKIYNSNKFDYRKLIKFVNDRPGHDKRYSVNNDKIFKKLKWSPEETFNTGITKTINWFIKNGASQ